MVCGLISLSASFISDHYGGPQLLYSLLIGLSVHFIYLNDIVKPGVEFTAKTILRLGVALLGIRITFSAIGGIGFETIVTVIIGVASTILFGLLLARWLKVPSAYGLISGGSVGICGASAALAIASALPNSKENERFTLLIVVGVTVLSTISMVLYPFLLHFVEASPMQAGIFIGATIHDVAQVVAAGMLFGPEAGDVATVVKLFRVALLLPIVVAITTIYSAPRSTSITNKKLHLIPGFLIGFIALSTIASLDLVNNNLVNYTSSLSKWMLIGAISAAGIKTNFEELSNLGFKPLILLLSETIFIALAIITLMIL